MITDAYIILILTLKAMLNYGSVQILQIVIE